MRSNNKLEITTLWEVLIAVKCLRLDKIHGYGDANGIIEWLNQHTNFNPPILENWMITI